MRPVETVQQVAAADPVLRRGPFLAVLMQGLPLALGLASHAVINLVDLALVGRLGDGAVQAAHVATTWNFLPMILGNCISTALLARLSRRLGEGDVAGARGLNVRAQWLLAWLGVVLGVATALPAALQVDATGLEGAVRDEAVRYLVVSNLGCLPMFVLMQATAAMRAAGEALVPLALLLLANLLNLGLDLVLMLGWPGAGVPALGVVGAAYASVASRCVAAALAVAWLRRPGHVLSLRSAPRFAGAVARPLLLDAWPQAAQIALRAGVVVGLTVLVQRRFGDEATVSLGITTRLDTLTLFASLGFANAATAYAGRAVVVGWPGRARRAGLWAALLAMGFGAAFVGCCVVWNEAIVAAFLPSPSSQMLALTSLYFASAAWSQVLGAGALGAIGAVHGAGRMLAPLLVDVLGFGVAAAVWWGLAGDSRAPLAACYEALCWGMLALLVAQLAHVGLGRWPRPL